ncbi:DUF4250 domain-containing protein [Anaeromicropila populeti]|uniref:DUF4250 domain-containing protein n=1 Tax=Anaeromicropila populeti TaxID=37658 RepID=A0A1I6JQY1_9FIRM|nr:DUF4250 domain-containing protein [Anaeromicropila populeti]SFR81367.1 protein of unknown function [Anaeromicropila populeti]
MKVPNDSVMLLSYINTQLRDNYESLDDLCKNLNLVQADIENKLQNIDYIYDLNRNQFICN